MGNMKAWGCGPAAPIPGSCSGATVTTNNHNQMPGLVWLVRIWFAGWPDCSKWSRSDPVRLVNTSSLCASHFWYSVIQLACLLATSTHIGDKSWRSPCTCFAHAFHGPQFGTALHLTNSF
jgi:hypothetical protein